MGVRGLTTYIAKRSDRYLEPYELRDCSIVIDGNNLASHLYSWVSKCNCAFGGDYDRYASCVESFFAVLSKCQVTPVVLFDGGYETKKLSTVRERFKNKLSTAKIMTPIMQSKFCFFPLFMKDVFKDVLKKLRIPFVQCDFEADGEIAVVARSLHCPVLSYDSDFYVYDVLYIPFSTVSLEPLQDAHGKYYLSCKIYSVEKFLNSFGGLDKPLLPVMAILLGNDYIERKVFKNFLSQIKVPKNRSMSKTQQRIIALLEWLRRETLETAVQKILSRLKKGQREAITEQIQEIITGYTICSSELLPYLLSSRTVCFESDTVVTSTKKDELSLPYLPREDSTIPSDDISDSEDDEETDACSDTSDDLDPVGLLCRKSELPRTLFPDWFKENLRCGNLPPCFVNMLIHHMYLVAPQIEDFSLPFSQQISMPILCIIYGLLTAGHAKSEQNLNCFARKQNAQLEKFTLTPVYNTISVCKFPSLEKIPSIPLTIRRALMFDTIGFNACDIQTLNTFPDDWKIFILALIYWGRNVSEPALALYHIHAILFSVIVLKVVDAHAGYYKSRKAFLKQNGAKLRKLVNLRCEKDNGRIKENSEDDLQQTCGTKLPSVEDDGHDDVVSEAIAKVLKEECVVLVETLLPFRYMDESLKTRSKLFSVTLVHTFAQLQSCLLHVMYLNALLHFPFPQCLVAHFYSGTLVYNTCTNFKKRSDVQAYILTHLLKSVPSLGRLYKVLVKTVVSLLPATTVISKHKRKPKKKKKDSCNIELVLEDERNISEGSETDELSSLMVNNRFFALSLSGK